MFLCVCVVSKDSPSFHLTESLTAPSITPSDVFSSTKGPALNDKICPHTHTHISLYHMTHTKNKQAATIHTYTCTNTHITYKLLMLWDSAFCSCYDACILMYGRNHLPPHPTPFIKLPLSSGHHHEQFPWQHTSKHWWQTKKKDPSLGFGHLLSKRNRGRLSLFTVMEVRAELAPKLFNLSLQESYNIVLQPFLFKAK